MSLLCNKQTQKTQTQKLEKIQKIVHCSCLINPSQACVPALQETNKNTKKTQKTQTQKNKKQKKHKHTQKILSLSVYCGCLINPLDSLCPCFAGNKHKHTQKHKTQKTRKQKIQNIFVHCCCPINPPHSLSLLCKKRKIDLLPFK